uniref:Uncharacterized protein n=1 Tax=Anguilla anguilla TaxID=7936 RepID=A0A0E9SHA9_ANGAN
MGTDCNLSAACHSSLTWEIGSPFSISVPNSCCQTALIRQAAISTPMVPLR